MGAEWASDGENLYRGGAALAPEEPKLMRAFAKLAFLALVAGLLGEQAGAAEVPALIKQLASENSGERARAIAELRKMGEPAREALAKIEEAETLELRQLLLVRRIQGDMLIAQTPLQPVGLTGLTPFSEDKEKGIQGNPYLLVNRDKKLISMSGEFVLEQGPLEYLVVTKGPNARLHETVAAVLARPRDICWALLACAYTFAGELSADGMVHLPKDAGVMVSIEYLWEPAHADMDTGLEAGRLIAEFQQKCALLDKANEQERDSLLLDLASGHGFLKRLLDRDEVDEAGKVTVRSPFTEELRDPDCLGDAAKRKLLLETLQDYLRKHPQSAGAAAGNHALPERKLVRAPIEFFAWNAQTGKTMKRAPFAFTGSKFEKDLENSKKMIFMADVEKSIIAAKLDPYAILNTPLDMRGIDPQHAAGYGINWRVVPRRGTKCRVVFEPWTGAELKDEDLRDTGDRSAKPAAAPTPPQ